MVAGPTAGGWAGNRTFVAIAAAGQAGDAWLGFSQPAKRRCADSWPSGPIIFYYNDHVILYLNQPFGSNAKPLNRLLAAQPAPRDACLP
jgi:hypothetical protein